MGAGRSTKDDRDSLQWQFSLVSLVTEQLQYRGMLQCSWPMTAWAVSLPSCQIKACCAILCCKQKPNKTAAFALSIFTRGTLNVSLLWDVPVCLRPWRFSLPGMKSFDAQPLRQSQKLMLKQVPLNLKLACLSTWLPMWPLQARFSLSAGKADLTSLQKAGEVGWHLTCNCRFGPSTAVPALLFSSHQPVMKNGRWPQYLPRVSRHQGLCSSSFSSAPQPPPLLSFWKLCTQGVAGSPSVDSLSSCLQPHVLTCPCCPQARSRTFESKPLSCFAT